MIRPPESGVAKELIAIVRAMDEAGAKLEADDLRRSLGKMVEIVSIELRQARMRNPADIQGMPLGEREQDKRASESNSTAPRGAD